MSKKRKSEGSSAGSVRRLEPAEVCFDHEFNEDWQFWLHMPSCSNRRYKQGLKTTEQFMEECKPVGSPIHTARQLFALLRSTTFPWPSRLCADPLPTVYFMRQKTGYPLWESEHHSGGSTLNIHINPMTESPEQRFVSTAPRGFLSPDEYPRSFETSPLIQLDDWSKNNIWLRLLICAVGEEFDDLLTPSSIRQQQQQPLEGYQKEDDEEEEGKGSNKEPIELTGVAISIRRDDYTKQPASKVSLWFSGCCPSLGSEAFLKQLFQRGILPLEEFLYRQNGKQKQQQQLPLSLTIPPGGSPLDLLYSHQHQQQKSLQMNTVDECGDRLDSNDRNSPSNEPSIIRQLIQTKYESHNRSIEKHKKTSSKSTTFRPKSEKVDTPQGGNGRGYQISRTEHHFEPSGEYKKYPVYNLTRHPTVCSQKLGGACDDNSIFYYPWETTNDGI